MGWPPRSSLSRCGYWNAVWTMCYLYHMRTFGASGRAVAQFGIYFDTSLATKYCSSVTIKVHGFADASSKAYGAVIHLRLLKADQVIITLQYFNSRVALTKTLSKSRLDLCAAHLLARIVDRYLCTMKFENSTLHLSSESKNVLFWIRVIPARWQTFVANRCS